MHKKNLKLFHNSRLQSIFDTKLVNEVEKSESNLIKIKDVTYIVLDFIFVKLRQKSCEGYSH